MTTENLPFALSDDEALIDHFSGCWVTTHRLVLATGRHSSFGLRGAEVVGERNELRAVPIWKILAPARMRWAESLFQSSVPTVDGTLVVLTAKQMRLNAALVLAHYSSLLTQGTRADSMLDLHCVRCSWRTEWIVRLGTEHFVVAPVQFARFPMAPWVAWLRQRTAAETEVVRPFLKEYGRPGRYIDTLTKGDVCVVKVGTDDGQVFRTVGLTKDDARRLEPQRLEPQQ